MDGPLFNENILSFGVAYGLAVQGLQKARLLTNLLPPEIKMERLIKAKKPWAAAAHHRAPRRPTSSGMPKHACSGSGRNTSSTGPSATMWPSRSSAACGAEGGTSSR